MDIISFFCLVIDSIDLFPWLNAVMKIYLLDVWNNSIPLILVGSGRTRLLAAATVGHFKFLVSKILRIPVIGTESTGALCDIPPTEIIGGVTKEAAFPFALAFFLRFFSSFNKQ
jgi:hypothetical protein